MSSVKTKQTPHPSHKMSEWESTIVTLVSTSRFGSIRRCEYCDGEQAVTVAGEGMHDELKRQCTAIPTAPTP